MDERDMVAFHEFKEEVTSWCVARLPVTEDEGDPRFYIALLYAVLNHCQQVTRTFTTTGRKPANEIHGYLDSLLFKASNVVGIWTVRQAWWPKTCPCAREVRNSSALLNSGSSTYA